MPNLLKQFLKMGLSLMGSCNAGRFCTSPYAKYKVNTTYEVVQQKNMIYSETFYQIFFRNMNNNSNVHTMTYATYIINTRLCTDSVLCRKNDISRSLAICSSTDY